MAREVTGPRITGSVRESILQLTPMTVEMTADVMGMSDKAVYKWISDGELFAYRQRFGRARRSRLVVPAWSVVEFQERRAAAMWAEIQGKADAAAVSRRSRIGMKV